MTRRTLLLGTAGLAIGSLLTGCQTPAQVLSVTLLEGTIGPEILKRFRQQVDSDVKFEMAAQLPKIFQQLQRWANGASATSGGPHHLVSLSDYWLGPAIAQQLIEPLSLSEQTWKRLPSRWQQFVSRDATGQIVSGGQPWAAPYKVQALAIVYSQSRLEKSLERLPSFQRWADLLTPPLAGRLALPAHPRLLVGLLQKMSSGSFNLTFEGLDEGSAAVSAEETRPERSPPSTVSQSLAQSLEPTWAQLRSQAKTYDDLNGLKALINGDVDIAVAWSGDVVAALNRYQDLKVAVPAEGTLLSADLWVRPRGAAMTAAAQQWIDFCWQRDPATQISITGKGLSPVFLGEDSDRPALLENTLRLLPRASLAAGEPLLPLTIAQQEVFEALWKQLLA